MNALVAYESRVESGSMMRDDVNTSGGHLTVKQLTNNKDGLTSPFNVENNSFKTQCNIHV